MQKYSSIYEDKATWFLNPNKNQRGPKPDQSNIQASLGG